MEHKPHVLSTPDKVRLSLLADDMIREIMRHLEPKYLKRFEITCRRFYSIGHNTSLWRYWSLQKWLKSADQYKGPKDFIKYPSDGIDWQDYYATKSIAEYEKLKELPVRLFIFRAKNSPTAVILRRGPRKYWMMIKWNTVADTFEYGQWFRGYIQVPFCHLREDGEQFVYSATKFSAQAGQHWTAVCKVPNFTPIALWSNDSVHEGGGRYMTKTQLRLFRPSSTPAVIAPNNLRIFSNEDQLPQSFVKQFLKLAPQTVSESGSPELRPMPLLYENGVHWEKWYDARVCPCEVFHSCPLIEYTKPYLHLKVKWVDMASPALAISYRRSGTYFLEDKELQVDWADLDLSQKRLVYSEGGKLFSKSFTLDNAKKILWGEVKLLRDFTALQCETNKKK